MKDADFVKLFDYDNIVTSESRRDYEGEGEGEGEPVYVPGGRFGSMKELQEFNETQKIGQIGGSRKSKSKSKKRRVNRKKSKKSKRTSTRTRTRTRNRNQRRR